MRVLRALTVTAAACAAVGLSIPLASANPVSDPPGARATPTADPPAGPGAPAPAPAAEAPTGPGAPAAAPAAEAPAAPEAPAAAPVGEVPGAPGAPAAAPAGDPPGTRGLPADGLPAGGLPAGGLAGVRGGDGDGGRGGDGGNSGRGPSNVTVNPYSVHQGSTMQVSAAGCTRGGTVWSPNNFPQANLSAGSIGFATVRIFNHASPGNHTLSVKCNDNSLVATHRFTILEGRGAQGGLGGSFGPSTAETAIGASLVGAGALGAGIHVLRRRRPARNRT
ncbi:hypothetical protein AB0F11_23450 [Streptomyces sp. NPDC032472]|uniref:hypothetical protein n=1 Tax=Streptomyces sp. NPDC032472 TaxID=3155018 RepID=UPI0033F7F865